MLVDMINFCKPKIEFEVQHNKTNEAILKQFMHQSMIYIKKRSKMTSLGIVQVGRRNMKHGY
jgi:hypothetical protein